MQGPPFRVGRFLTQMLAIAALADPAAGATPPPTAAIARRVSVSIE